MTQAATWTVPTSSPPAITPEDWSAIVWENFQAILSTHAGSSRPSYAVAHTIWVDSSSAPYLVKYFDGTDDITIGSVDPTGNTFTVAGIGSIVQGYDADLAAIAALTTTAGGRSVLELADPNADRILAWDDSAGAIVAIALADIAAEAAPATGDYLLIYGAEGDLRKVDWSDLPSASGLSNVVEDTTPQLGGALDGQGFDLTAIGVLFLTEQAAAEADVAGQGQLWVKTATPNELWFTDDAGTDFEILVDADIGVTVQGYDADLAAIAALTTTAGGRSVLELADPNADRILAWDDTAGAIVPIALADIAAEGAPATGDYVLIYGAEGDLRKVDWSDLPGAGGGISNVVEDTTPQLGGALDGQGFDLTAMGVLFLTEQAAAEADVAGQGQIWVKTATPNQLWFTDDAGTDFEVLLDADIGVTVQGYDADLAAIAALTTTAGGRSVLELADPNADRILAWDDSAGAIVAIALADIAAEAAPATGDYLLIYGAEGDLRKVDWSDLPSGSGIANVVEDTTPQLGGALDGQGFDLTAMGVLFLTEQAAAEADVAGQGQIWVLTATPNILKFTDDAGSDFTVAMLEDLASTANGKGAALIGIEDSGGLITAATVEGALAENRAAIDAIEADYLTTAAAAAAYQPLDADLTALAALTTTAAGRSVLAVADPNADRILAWDDTAGAIVPIALADIAAEAAPATGDYLLIYGAEGDLRKVNWSDLPSGSGIANVVEDTTPQLGGALDGQGFDLTAMGVLFLTEQAAAEADVAGQGQLWVKTVTPNQLWFTDDAGNDYPVALGGKQAIWVPAQAMVPATTSGPAGPNLIETPTNDVNYYTLDFDASADEHAHFAIAFPASWDLGSVTFQAFWRVNASVATGVAWGLQSNPISDANGIDSSWITPTVVTDDAQGSAGELLVSVESGAVAVTGAIDGDLVFFRVFRDVSDANDDMTQDALLLGILIFYTTDKGNDV